MSFWVRMLTTLDGNVLPCTIFLLLVFYSSNHYFKSDPEERPSATELRKHPYLLLPDNWEFTGFT